MNQMFFAHSKLQDSSRAQNVSGIVVPLKRERRFEYIDVPLGSGKMRDRTFLDSEAKLFEFFADLYEQNPFKSITMLSERGMCDSCLGVMKQFKKRYPQVKIIVVSNKKVEGVPWKFRRLKK